jgi:penicillin amidase
MATPDVPLMLRIIREKAGLVRRRRHAPDRDLRGRHCAGARSGARLDQPPARDRTSRAGNGASSTTPPIAIRCSTACRCCATSPRCASPRTAAAQTLNRAQPSYRGSRPFEAIHGAGYRGVYDFSDLDNSRFAMPLGQSGNMLSPWARNFVQRWQSLSYIEIAGSRAELGRSAVGTITLAPPTR